MVYLQKPQLQKDKSKLRPVNTGFCKIWHYSTVSKRVITFITSQGSLSI